MSTQILSEIRTKTIFDLDWIKITKDGYLDQIIKVQEDQDKVKEILLSKYPVLSEVFRSFSAVSTGAGVCRMDIREFSNFVHNIGALNVSTEGELLRKIFEESFPGDVPEEKRLHSEMALPNFFLALIHLACAIYVDYAILKHLPQMGYGNIGRRRSMLLSHTGNVHITMPEAVQKLLDEYLLPYAERNLTGFLVKEMISTDEVLAVYGEFHESLNKAYRHYAKLSGGSFTLQNLMDVKEFYALAKDAKIVDRDYNES